MRQPAELTEAAWEALDELVRTGSFHLAENPVAQKPETKTVVDVLKWLATLQGKPKKGPKAMDDWQPKETKAL